MADNDPRPLHEQVTAEIRAQIMDGSITGQLPTAVALAESLDVSVGTITRTLGALRGEGLVYSRRGRGAGIFAADQNPLAPVELRYAVVAVETVRAPGDVRAALGADIAVMCRQLGYDGETPAQVRESYLLGDVASKANVRRRKHLPELGALLTEIGLRPCEVSEVVTARAPTSRELELLGLPEAVNVVRILRTYVAGDVTAADVILTGANRWRLRREVPLS